jgi:hypothetical protein
MVHWKKKWMKTIEIQRSLSNQIWCFISSLSTILMSTPASPGGTLILQMSGKCLSAQSCALGISFSESSHPTKLWIRMNAARTVLRVALPQQRQIICKAKEISDHSVKWKRIDFENYLTSYVLGLVLYQRCCLKFLSNISLFWEFVYLECN